MTQRTQWRRQTAAFNETFTGALAEVTVDTDTGQLRVHNGSTPGGAVVNPFFAPEWFGARGDGTADDGTALQDAINASEAQKIPVKLRPDHVYRTTTGLIINDHYVELCSGGSPGVGYLQTLGAVIRYEGTGTGLLIGIAPGTNATYIYGTQIRNVRIETDDDCAIGMRVWHSVHGRFEDIAIYGMTGPTNVDLQVEGGVDNIYEHCDCQGQGQSVETDYAQMAKGLVGKLGYSNEPATTTIFRRCFFHYCSYAVQLYYFFDFEDCVFESSDYGTVGVSEMHSNFTRCWWENNQTADIYFADASVQIYGGGINSYARQDFFGGAGVKNLSMRDVRFQSSHVAPRLFQAGPSAFDATGRGVASGCRFPTAMTVGGASGRDYQRFQLTDMRRETYRFKAAAVTGTGTINPMLHESGLAMSLVAPEKGHFLGLNVYSSGALTGGTYTVTPQNNGSNITALVQASGSTQRVNTKSDHFASPFAAGDLISISFAYSGLTSTTDFVVELLVAFGDSGEGL